MKYTGQTLDQLKEEVRPQAEMKVKSRLLLEKLFDSSFTCFVTEYLEHNKLKASEVIKLEKILSDSVK